MKFWDASAIIPLCLEEPWTPWLTQVLAEDTLMIVWWGSLVECWSALARLRREGLFQSSEEEHARALLARLAMAWTEVLPSQAVRDHAAHALQRHPLRAADGLQLAAALVWVQGRGSRAASPLSVWIIACGLPPSVKVFSSCRLQHPCKRPHPPSASKARVPPPRPSKGCFLYSRFWTFRQPYP
jgi:predicted nucleic acid-binding protein